MRAPREAVDIVFDAATKRYPGRQAPAVDNLSFSIAAGEICCLVGPSGGGKTTAMKLVNRLVELTSGDVRIDGRSVRDLDETELRRGIGYVIQQVGLFPHMTVAENVATVPRLLGWRRDETRTRVDELLDLVELPAVDYRSRYASQLSGGERQRVGLARALAADPPVMLMDEPFGALDPITRTRLQKELLRIQGEVRKTIVFVTHDIDEAILIGDRIAILREGGRLAQVDTPEQILARPADDFVARVRRRGPRPEAALADDARPDRARSAERRRDAVRRRGDDAARRALADALGGIALARRARRRRATARRAHARSPQRAAEVSQEPVIPDFGEASSCVAENRIFCPDWVRENWSYVFQPALVEHVKLTVIAVAVGFVIAFAAALRRPPLRRAPSGRSRSSARSSTRSPGSRSSSCSSPSRASASSPWRLRSSATRC